jgi:hypothetical protein
MAHFQVPRNLPHAATIVRRIEYRLGTEIHEHPEADELVSCVQTLHDLLGKYEGEEEPIEAEAQQVAEAGVVTARKLVDEVERLSVGEDRLGQSIRNLFECLGCAEEGAEISLRAGEDPNSLMRPR